MICPTCNGNLNAISIEEIKLDACNKGCGGVWFDRFELQKLDEPHEFTDENLIDLLSANSKVDHDKTTRHICPKCKDIVMMRNFFSVKRELEIDHCPKCGGYWLDEGELFNIRKQFDTEEERKKATTEYFSVLFDVELSKMKQAGQEKIEKAQKIANMFRLITPSHYFSKIKNK